MEVTINFWHMLLACILYAAAGYVFGYLFGRATGKYRTVINMIEAGYRRPDAKEVWGLILDNFDNDNNFQCERLDEDYERVEDALDTLIRAGYFFDDPLNIHDSFWIIAAGEETEMSEYFRKEPVAFQVVNQVLQDIFERS